MSALPTAPERTLRGGDIQQVFALLQQQERHKVDVVVSTSLLRSYQGNFEINGLDPVLVDSGVLDISGSYRPVGPVDTQVSKILDIPVRYIRKLRAELPSLLDTNVNELASRAEGKILLRLLWGSDPNYPDTSGVIRAVLSDRYRALDNLDTLLSVLDGMHEAGLGPESIQSIDLSDNSLYLRVNAPGVEVAARKLMAGYRSPFTGQTGEDMPLVRAGIEVTNSEVGSGAFNVKPVALFLACNNGFTIEADKFRRVHLGGRLEEGQIKWSDATKEAANTYVKSQVCDAVSTFLSKDYLEKVVADMEKDAFVELEKPEKVIEAVGRQLVYSKAEQEGILAHFIRGGQLTSGGVGQAVTSFSQTIEDVDRMHEFNSTAIAAMKLAAKIAS